MNQRWQNWSNTYRFGPHAVAQPSTRAELLAAVTHEDVIYELLLQPSREGPASAGERGLSNKSSREGPASAGERGLSNKSSRERPASAGERGLSDKSSELTPGQLFEHLDAILAARATRSATPGPEAVEF